jgi:SAM-dependent methyltransferase
MSGSANKPYSHIAGFYDRLMDHVDYPLWADFVRECWFRHADGLYHSMHDAACGTGRFLECMKEENVLRSGSDASRAMLKIARERLPDDVLLEHRDLRDPNDSQTFDLVTCLYDSVNYLLKEDELLLALRRLAWWTIPQGLFVFDICTERNSLDHFLDYEDEGVIDSWDYRRRSWYDGKRRLHYNRFDVQDLDTGERYTELHTQRIYLIREIEALLPQAGLDLLGCYREFGFERGSERADRVHFVCRPGSIR